MQYSRLYGLYRDTPSLFRLSTAARMPVIVLSKKMLAYIFAFVKFKPDLIQGDAIDFGAT
jgi:hypothetical protein